MIYFPNSKSFHKATRRTDDRLVHYVKYKPFPSKLETPSHISSLPVGRIKVVE